MRRLLPVLAAVLLLVAGLSVASRVFSPAVGSSAAPCGDPTASCWANGRPPIYLAKVQQRSIDPAEPYATIVSRLLNTGPNIPRLIAAAPLAGFGRIHAATATLATAEGVRSVNVQRIDRARMVLWNLGPVPNGAIVTFTIRADFPPDPTAIAYPTFYAALPAVGLPPDSSRIRNDTAPLATAASRPVKTPAAAAPTLTSVPFAGELTFPPLSRSSLYWLNFGSGFHLVLPRSSARFSEVSAARAAVNVASVGKQKATVLEAGLRTLIQQYQNFPTLTGRTFWVFSLQPANPRIHARWFFVLVDAQNGRVARIYDQLTVVGLSGHVPGEPPLVHLPGVPSAQQAMMGLLLYGSARRPLVSRQEAIALARQMSFALGGAASPAANPRANAVLARPWPFDGTLDWFVTQRVLRPARGGRRSPAIQLVRVDALTGKLVSSFCCFTPAGASP